MVRRFFFASLLVSQVITATATRDVPVSKSVHALSHGKGLPEDSNRLEDSRVKRSDDGGPVEAMVMKQAQELSLLKAQLAVTKAQLETKGSTFVRWGRSECPGEATTIYSGYAGGGNGNDPGAGANRICMTKVPVYDDMTILSAHGTVYGAQYHLAGHNHATDVMCSLCHAPFFATFMVPGTNTCPDGTTKQYHGYLSVGNFGSNSASEFLCLDANPVDRPGTTISEAGAWFDHTATVCGSLPCPPYVTGKAVTCVVCSK